MNTRELIEKREHEILTVYAAKSDESKGRRDPEDPCDIRTDYQRDRDRIIHSKSFRRLMHKTQVFIAPEEDHYRTRLTHTIEVSQIARTIARGAGLNEDLTEAIALGHDLGHTPFGHQGEFILDKIYSKGFRHNEQSLRVVDVLESSSARRGMNLTEEVRDGILNHTGPVLPTTIEGQVVKISDRIAYINHDIDDAISSGIITTEDLPKVSLSILGRTHKQRIDTLVRDMISNTFGQDRARMSDEKYGIMTDLRRFMFKNVYNDPRVKRIEDVEEIEKIMKTIFEYFMEHPDRLPSYLKALEDLYDREDLVKDYIAGMTDRYAVHVCKQL